MKKKNGQTWMRKIAWIGFYVAVAYTLFAAIQFKANQHVTEVVVNIYTDNKERALIGKEDILRYIKKSLNKDLEIQKIEELEVKEIEKVLNKSRFVERAEVFVNTKGIVFIDCFVRTPIVRFDRGEKKGFYLDTEGEIIPLSNRATVRVPLANGDLGNFSKDFLDDKNSRYKQVFDLAKKVHEDPFLHALIEQIYVESNGEVIMVPKLGRQKIHFGDLVRVDKKFEKLKAFYKTGMPNTGWNRFEYLHLEWKDQVVGNIGN